MKRLLKPVTLTRTIWRSLGVRLAVFLTVALLPVGLVGFFQTRAVLDQSQVEARQVLENRTRAAANAERIAVSWGLGVADGLGSLAIALEPTSAACQATFEAFAASHPDVSTVGFIAADGMMACSSHARDVDLSTWSKWADITQTPRRFVTFETKPIVSSEPVLASMTPIYDGEVFAGYAFVSQKARTVRKTPLDFAGGQFITFTPEGVVLSTSGADVDDASFLPTDLTLADFSQMTNRTFVAASRAGLAHVYSVIPIIDDTVYALGIWPADEVTALAVRSSVQLPLFPVLMWLISAIVAYTAVHRLVVRHIKALRRHMNQFAKSRTLSPAASDGMAYEIAEIYDTFHLATETIIRDEADLEALLHEKNVLLKEVHHRVKNNLQLISSIMNMQLRKIRAPEAMRVVKHLQSRVLSLATVHRNLYRSANLTEVNAGELLDQLVNQLAALAETGRTVQIETAFDPIVLYPDQAVPVSLLTTEAVTNALKYIGPDAEGQRKLSVALSKLPDGRARLVVRNSLSPTAAPPAPDADSTGLGTSLIRAFAAQLDTHVVTEQGTGFYQLSCVFVLEHFQVPEEEAA